MFARTATAWYPYPAGRSSRLGLGVFGVLLCELVTLPSNLGMMCLPTRFSAVQFSSVLHCPVLCCAVRDLQHPAVSTLIGIPLFIHPFINHSWILTTQSTHHHMSPSVPKRPNLAGMASSKVLLTTFLSIPADLTLLCSALFWKTVPGPTIVPTE